MKIENNSGGGYYLILPDECRVADVMFTVEARCLDGFRATKLVFDISHDLTLLLITVSGFRDLRS